MLETSDVLVLARLQFAFTISAHIIFPAISIGLANYLAVLEGLWLRTGKVARAPTRQDRCDRRPLGNREGARH